MAAHDLDDLVRITGEFRVAEELQDPETAILRIVRPDETAIEYVFGVDPDVDQEELEHVDEGIFAAELTPTGDDQVGVWNYRWRSTGEAQAGEPGQFVVRPEFFQFLRPTIEDVSGELRARTKQAGTGGSEAGVFNANTRPTATQVEVDIDWALDQVAMRVGVDIPKRLWGTMKNAAALRAAMRIERSYYPEQAADENSVYELLRDEYRDLIKELVESVVDPTPGSRGAASIELTTSVAASDPYYSSSSELLP